MPLTVVILAAGQGKRMGSDLPKVLQPLAGRPLLAHVVETARALGPAAIHVVYGHGGELVRAAFAGTELGWALQAEQKGTGHALMQAMPAVPDGHAVLVLYGVRTILNSAQQGAMVFKSVVFPEWWLYAPVPLCFGLLAVEFVRRLTGR